MIKIEGLFDSKMHPHCITSEISNEWLRQLIRKLRDYARYWYDCCKGPGSSKPNRKNVYGRAKCGFCNNEITLIRDGVLKRITYLCASCQSFPTQHDIIEKKRRENISNNILPTARIFLPIQGQGGHVKNIIFDPVGCPINSHDNNCNKNKSNINNSTINGNENDKNDFQGIFPVQDPCNWKCHYCTLENPNHLTVCEICDTVRPSKNILHDNKATSYSTDSKECSFGNHPIDGNGSREYSVAEAFSYAYSDSACHDINIVRNNREERESIGPSFIDNRLIRNERSSNSYPNQNYNYHNFNNNLNRNDVQNNNSNSQYICTSNTSTYSNSSRIFSIGGPISNRNAHTTTSTSSDTIINALDNDVESFSYDGRGEKNKFWQINKENMDNNVNDKKDDNNSNDNNNNHNHNHNHNHNNSNKNNIYSNGSNNNSNGNNNSNDNNNNNNSNNKNSNNNDNDSSCIQHSNIVLDTAVRASVGVNDEDISGSGHAFIVPLFCKCTKQCTLHRVRKSGPTNSRLFWSCTARKCDFFSWGDGTFPKCQHGSPTTVRRVLKIGPTNGKYFFCCSQEKKCDFFLWSSKHVSQCQILLKSKPLPQSLPLPLSCSLITNHYPQNQNQENKIISSSKRSLPNSLPENNIPVVCKKFKFVTIPL